MVQLSERLRAVADLAGEAEVVADVGTDHGYIPVFLVSSGKAERAVAMDVNEGPLLRAREHILQFDLEARIETRLSDGMKELTPGEAQVIVIAGMGGALMMRILAEGEAVARAAKRLVVQPQSEIFAFRRFLTEQGYHIVDENMVYEDGKYYSMMAVEWATQARDSQSRITEMPDGKDGGSVMTEADLKYGPLLLAGRHPVLHRYLLYQKKQKQKILENIGKNARQNVSERRAQVISELEEIQVLLASYWPES